MGTPEEGEEGLLMDIITGRDGDVDNWKEVIQSWKAGEITAVEAMRLTGMRKSSFYKLVKSL